MSKLITNEDGNTLINRLNALIEKYNSKITLHIISGFFNAKAFEALALSQDKLNSVKMILGKSEQAISKDDIAFYLDENELDIFDEQLDDIKATKIAHNFIKNHQVTIHTLKNNTQLIHSKMYFLYDENNANIEQNAIIGSSNFTASGLGLTGGGGGVIPTKSLISFATPKKRQRIAKSILTSSFHNAKTRQVS